MSQFSAWMPLYVGDYLGDTMHLVGPEHGAYLLLLMHYWRTGPLPDDDRALAAIARTEPAPWSAMAPTIRAFFRPDGGRLHHARCDRERAKAAGLADQRREAGRASARARGGNDRSNARSTVVPSRSNENPAERGPEGAEGAEIGPKSAENQRSFNGRSTSVATTAATGVAFSFEQSQSQSHSTSALRAGAHAPPVAEVEVTVEAEAEAPDARAELWRDGLAIVGRLTGKPPAGCRSLVGRWLRDLKDDCAALLLILREAEAARPVDPVPWITAAIAARAAPPADDPWGVRAWLARQPDVTMEPAEDGGEPVACIGDGVVELWGEHIAEAAGLPPSWRGSWDAMGGWMRDGLGLTPAVLSAIRDQAARAAARGEGVSSMRFFDACVRAAAGRRAA